MTQASLSSQSSQSSQSLGGRAARLAVVPLALAAAASGALAAGPSPKVDTGRMEYVAHCAICHGDTGTGQGEMRRFLTVAPADLTTIASRNGGTFPAQKLREVIDGRAAVGAHGTRDMPVWGGRFRQEAMEDAGTRGTPEWEVRSRIDALVDYLSRLQAR